MAFLREKRSAGRTYLYLVESEWDPATRRPRQRVLAYLGRLDRAGGDRLPARLRTPELVAEIERRAAGERDRVRSTTCERSVGFLGSLLAGDRPRARAIARRTIREQGAPTFYERVLTPALHEVGARFARREISVSAEHLASGTAQAVLSDLSAPVPDPAPDAPTVVLCVPDGEAHALPLQVAEGLLRRKGYRALNVGGSAPEPAVREFVRSHRPAAVLVSVTLPEHRATARRLARALRRDRPGMQVVLGGQAFPPEAAEAGNGAEVVPGSLGEFLEGWPDVRASRTPSRPAVRTEGSRVGRERSVRENATKGDPKRATDPATADRAKRSAAR